MLRDIICSIFVMGGLYLILKIGVNTALKGLAHIKWNISEEVEEAQKE